RLAGYRRGHKRSNGPQYPRPQTRLGGLHHCRGHIGFTAQNRQKSSGPAWISAHDPDLHSSRAHYACRVFHCTSESICRPDYWLVGLSPFTDICVWKFRALQYRHKIPLGAAEKMPTSHIILYVVAKELIKGMANMTLKYRELRHLFSNK